MALAIFDSSGTKYRVPMKARAEIPANGIPPINASAKRFRSSLMMRLVGASAAATICLARSPVMALVSVDFADCACPSLDGGRNASIWLLSEELPEKLLHEALSGRPGRLFFRRRRNLGHDRVLARLRMEHLRLRGQRVEVLLHLPDLALGIFRSGFVRPDPDKGGRVLVLGVLHVDVGAAAVGGHVLDREGLLEQIHVESAQVLHPLVAHRHDLGHVFSFLPTGEPRSGTPAASGSPRAGTG